MSSWRFGDVQHSLSLSCDFILRLPLWGLSALRAAFSLRSLAGAIMEQVRLNQGAAGMRAAQRDARSSALMNLASLVTDTSQTPFFRCSFTLRMRYSASSMTWLNQKWNRKRPTVWISALFRLQSVSRASLGHRLAEEEAQTTVERVHPAGSWRSGSEMKTGRI